MNLEFIEQNKKSKFKCHICGIKGNDVEFDTVFSLTNDYIKHTLIENKFYICINPMCAVGYYTPQNRVIYLSDIKTDIWFKKKKNKFIVCYCRDISIDDVVFAVSKIEKEITISKVVHFLQKDDIKPNCIFKNPCGVCCEKLFINAIEYGKKVKNKKLI